MRFFVDCIVHRHLFRAERIPRELCRAGGVINVVDGIAIPTPARSASREVVDELLSR